MESSEYLQLIPQASSTPFTSHTVPSPIIADTRVYTQLYSNSLHPVLNNKASNSQRSHRQRIVKEIFDTEHAYISQLHTIITLFLKPIRVRGLLPQDVISAIFSNIEGILSVNKELFSCMRQHSLGEAFAYLGPFLKLYSTYASNFQNANSVLQDWLRNNDGFARFISLQESRPECCGLRLSSLLITPIQRIPRYKLLLSELLKHTRLNHKDYDKLSIAAAQIESTASHINEYIRQHENFKKMLSIQHSLTGPAVPGILAPARNFIHEGKLMKICYRNKKGKERMVFLFSDIMIYARPKFIKTRDQTRKYECRCVLPLLCSSVEVVEKDRRAPSETGPLLKVYNDDTVLLFYSEYSQEVNKWAQIIQQTIQSLQSSYGSLMKSQKDDLISHGVQAQDGAESSPQSLLSATTTQQLDLATLTPKTPYPLTATLFSTHMDAALSHSNQLQKQGGTEVGNSGTIRKNIVQDYDTTMENADSDEDMESDRDSEGTGLPQVSRCCIIS